MNQHQRDSALANSLNDRVIVDQKFDAADNDGPLGITNKKQHRREQAEVEGAADMDTINNRATGPSS